MKKEREKKKEEKLMKEPPTSTKKHKNNQEREERASETERTSVEEKATKTKIWNQKCGLTPSRRGHVILF